MPSLNIVIVSIASFSYNLTKSSSIEGFMTTKTFDNDGIGPLLSNILSINLNIIINLNFEINKSILKIYAYTL